MKTTFFILMIFFYLSTESYAQLDITRQNCFVGPEYDEGNDIIKTSDGYLIVGGYSFYSSNPLMNTQEDLWIIKTDFEGNLIWDKTLGGSEPEDAKKILKSNDGNYYIIGIACSNDGDLINTPYPTSENIWLLKIDSLGNVLWQKVLGGNSADRPATGIITHDNGIIITGSTQSVDGDVSNSIGSWDIWMVKLTPDGVVVWDYTFGTEGIDIAHDVIETSDKGLLVCGTSAMYGNGNIACDSPNEWGQSIITKFDSLYNIEWQRCYGGTDHETANCALEIDDGYLIGNTASSVDGDIANTGFHGGSDIWIQHLDHNGNLIWGKCFGGSELETPQKIIKSGNNFLIFGSTNSHDGDVIGNMSSIPITDVWVLKINESSELLWQQCIGGRGNEIILNGVAEILPDHYIMTASTYGDQGDGEISCISSPPLNDYDVWLCEFADTTVTSISENLHLNAKLYPNPVTDFIVFESTDLLKGKYLLKDLYGRNIKSGNIIDGNAIVNTEKLPSGLYYFNFSDQNGHSSTQKIIVIR